MEGKQPQASQTSLLTYLVWVHIRSPYAAICSVFYISKAGSDTNLAQSMGDINTSRPKRHSDHIAKP